MHACSIRSQTALTRLAPRDAPHADKMLRELARRLLGVPLTAERPDKKARSAWRAGAAFLTSRIQTEHMDAYGRAPDVSVSAADAMRAVLTEIATECEM